MKIKAKVMGAFQTNCYIVWNEKTGRGVVIDPACDVKEIRMTLAAEQITLTHILLTHGHVDHITGAQELKEATGAKTVIGKEDAHFMTEPRQREFAVYFPTNFPNTEADITVSEGDKLEAGDMEFTVLQTPGHTFGSVCYLCEKTLFAGDTLFQGSCGRTDLETGSFTEMMQSLARLATLPDDTMVLPGHGGSTTIGDEKYYNPYMQQSSGQRE